MFSCIPLLIPCRPVLSCALRQGSSPWWLWSSTVWASSLHGEPSLGSTQPFLGSFNWVDHCVFIVSPSQPDSAQRLSMPQRCKHEGLSNLVAFDLSSRLTRLGLMPHQEIFSMAEKAPWGLNETTTARDTCRNQCTEKRWVKIWNMLKWISSTAVGVWKSAWEENAT